MPHQDDYNEAQISKIPALEVLQGLGYSCIPPPQARAMRGSLYNVLLTDVLREQLERLNSYEYKGNICTFSAKNIAQAMQDLDEPLNEGLLKTNEKIFDRLPLGESYLEKLPDGATRAFTLRYIDWETPHNNVFHVSEEFAVEREDGQDTLRPDIVLFVNGIPFAVIECKKASIAIKEGISQMIRNQGRDAIPHLFKFAQIVVSANKNACQYATCGTPEKFWSLWKEENQDWQRGIVQRIVPHRLPTVQDNTLVSLFEPQRVLELIRFFTLYEKNAKKIARYQQCFAVKTFFRKCSRLTSRGGANRA